MDGVRPGSDSTGRGPVLRESSRASRAGSSPPAAGLARIALCAAALVLPAAAQAPAPPGSPGARPGPAAAPRPYAEVIGAGAVSQAGLFGVHRVEERLYFEIPAALLGRELLWVTTLERAQAGFGFGGTEVQDRVVRWSRRGNRVLLREVDHQIRAEGDDGLRRAVERSNLEPILRAVDVAAEGPGGAVVIDATPLFATEIPEFSPRRAVGVGPMDPSRSFIERARAFPTNLEISVTATYAAAAGPPSPAAAASRRGPAPASVTLVLHHSLVALPEQPMKPRLWDARVGYFSGEHVEYAGGEHRAAERRYIRRWRLEKKDPAAALSEPVRPIVYYIAREVPEKWRSWLKKGVEDWQPAFEAAGFKNAIVARDPPTEAEDPEWDPEDARYSTIHWLPSTIANAYGPHIADPRTGEILDADIKFFHNSLDGYRRRYFVQASAVDARARKLPLPDDIIGEQIRQVCAHEVGHTLGLAHNMRASSAVSIRQLRDPEWTRRWGIAASIMDYARINYVAQPGDDVRMVRKLGPYDLFAIEWGYRPFPQAATPADERPYLDAIAARQVSDPMLRFGAADPGEDPGRQTEDLSSDPVAATELGLRNLKRVLEYVVPATSRLGDDYTELRALYEDIVRTRTMWLMHVAALVGGAAETAYHHGRGGLHYEPVPPERQRAALRFLLEHAFATPRELLRPEILGRIEAAGAGERVLRSQTAILEALLSERRAERMVDQAALSGGRGYTLPRMMDELRAGIWSELAAPRVAVDPYRRRLQRACIAALGRRLAAQGESHSDLRALARGALADVRREATAALKRAPDRATRLHLEDCAAAAARLLDPRG